MTKPSFRSFTSMLLSFTFIVVTYTGLVMWLAPRNSSWNLGIGRGTFRGAHIYVSVAMIAAAVVHLIYNARIYWSYIWSGSRRPRSRVLEFLAALLVTVLVSSYPSWKSQGGGMPDISTMSPQQIAKQFNLSADNIVAALDKEGVKVKNPADNLNEIAKQNEKKVGDITPIVQKLLPQRRGEGGGPGGGRGEGEGRGEGRGPGGGRGEGRGFQGGRGER